MWGSVDYGEGHEGGDGEGDEDYQPDDEQDEAWVPFRGFKAKDQHDTSVEHDEERNGYHEDGGDHHNRSRDEGQDFRSLNGDVFYELVVKEAVAEDLTTPPE